MKIYLALCVSLWVSVYASTPENVLPLPELLPQDLEVELALSAAPPHLRDAASVFVLKRGGYTLIRKGTNGFHCLVRRSGVTPRIFYNILAPMCFDAEGTRTLLPALLEQTRLLEEKVPADRVLAAMDAGFASGKFKTPGPGINYMLSAANFLPDPKNPGHVFHYLPHWMFHAPDLQAEDVGQAPKLNIFGQEAFITPPGKPWSFLVIPVGQTERAQIAAAQSELVKKAKPYVRLAKRKS